MESKLFISPLLFVGKLCMSAFAQIVLQEAGIRNCGQQETFFAQGFPDNAEQ
jgi:hypothetical protein